MQYEKTLIASVDSVLQNMYDQYLPSFKSQFDVSRELDAHRKVL